MPKRVEYPPEPWQTPANAGMYLRHLLLKHMQSKGRWPSPSVLLSKTHRWPKQIVDEALLQLVVDGEVEEKVEYIQTGGGRRVFVVPTKDFKNELAVLPDATTNLRNKDALVGGDKAVVIAAIQRVERTHIRLEDRCPEGHPCHALQLAKMTRQLIGE